MNLTHANKSGPLSNIRVLDLGTYAVGPAAAAIAGFLGADVIRIENPRGDGFYDNRPQIRGMGASFINSNMHKRSVKLDLKSDEGQRKGLALCAWADVLIENRLPGVTERLGLGYEDASRANPGIVYISSPGFGSTGPYAGRPALDSYIQAFSGFASVQGAPGGDPEFFRVFGHLDHLASAIIVQAAVLGLMKRRKTGRGSHIEAGHLASAIFVQLNRLAEYFDTGQNPPRLGSASAVIAPSQSFRCQDGRFINISAPDNECWKELCGVLGLESAVEDPRFITPAARLAYRDELAEIISHRTTDAPAWWWLLALQRRSVPCGPCNYPDDVMKDPALQPSLERPETAWGRVWHGAKPWQFSATPAPPTRGTRRPGADQEEIEALIEKHIGAVQ